MSWGPRDPWTISRPSVVREAVAEKVRGLGPQTFAAYVLFFSVVFVLPVLFGAGWLVWRLAVLWASQGSGCG